MELARPLGIATLNVDPLRLGPFERLSEYSPAIGLAK